MISITRSFRFDAAHRVLGHEGKCRYLHGHSYLAEVTVSAGGLDLLGRVIDFSVIKERLGSWIDANWDHNILLHLHDPLNGVGAFVFQGKEPYFFQSNPTAEVIAERLFTKAIELLPSEIKVERVRVWETPNCYADYSR